MPSKSNGEPATRDDLKELNARLNVRIDKLDQRVERMDQKIDRVALDLVKTKEQMATKADISDMHKRFDQIINVLDSLNGQMVDHNRTIVVWDKILHEHRVKLDDHEKRLTALEE